MVLFFGHWVLNWISVIGVNYAEKAVLFHYAAVVMELISLFSRFDTIIITFQELYSQLGRTRGERKKPFLAMKKRKNKHFFL